MTSVFVSDSEFNDRADKTLSHLEDTLENYDDDIDLENNNGILTLEFNNGSKVIVNRQIATHEIWVAAKSGGYHCAYENNVWFCRTSGETLWELIQRVCLEQGGVELG